MLLVAVASAVVSSADLPFFPLQAGLFVAMFVVYNYLLLNLFIAIVLENFSLSEFDKVKHQEREYRESKENSEDEIELLKWLAGQAGSDIEAKKAVNRALMGVKEFKKKEQADVSALLFFPYMCCPSVSRSLCVPTRVTAAHFRRGTAEGGGGEPSPAFHTALRLNEELRSLVSS